MSTSPQRPSLLLIEDSDEDFVAFKRMITRSQIETPIYRCSSGDEALEFLNQQGEFCDPALAPRPALILLDLNLPGTDGREILSMIRREESLRSIPIVVFTTSSNPKDVEACYREGANGYILKPIEVTRLERTIQSLMDYWFNVSVLPGADL